MRLLVLWIYGATGKRFKRGHRRMEQEDAMTEPKRGPFDAAISILKIVDSIKPFKSECRPAIRVLEKAGKRPKIICLCGSTRFTEQMLIKQWELTKQGNVVLSWCALPDSYFIGEDKNHIGDQEGVKQIVDEVHKRKIDLADEVFVINVGGYVGDSTRSEIQYAVEHDKPICWLESMEALPDGGKP